MDGGSPPWLYCGDIVNAEELRSCYCVGGTCDDRACCMLPDGGYALQGDPACEAPSPRVACRSDCTCLAVYGATSGAWCDGIVCHVNSRQREPRGLCTPASGGAPGDCPCTGGTCDERRCCVLPDGTTAGPSDPACVPPDAGGVDAAWPS